MNIFVLDTDPVLAAQQQCDKHVVKMVLETAQLLCAQFEPGAAPYRRTHYSHPCSVWTRSSQANFQWLFMHGLALSDEYEFRYDKKHKSFDVIMWCGAHSHLLDIPNGELTEFAQAMPDECKRISAVEAYQEYYRVHKAYMAKWTKRNIPSWFVQQPA